MSKGTIFYVIGFILIVVPMMLNRYVLELPSILYYILVLGGFVSVYRHEGKGRKNQLELRLQPVRNNRTVQTERTEESHGRTAE